jgi:hypothetical protein
VLALRAPSQGGDNDVPPEARLQGSKHVQHEAVVVVSLWDVKLANIHMKRVDGVFEA